MDASRGGHDWAQCYAVRRLRTRLYETFDRICDRNKRHCILRNAGVACRQLDDCSSSIVRFVCMRAPLPSGSLSNARRFASFFGVRSLARCDSAATIDLTETAAAAALACLP